MVTRFGTGRLLAGVLGAVFCLAAGMATAAAPLQQRSASLQCLDRRIVVDADCFAAAGRTMSCTRQALRVFGAGGKPLGTRTFAPEPQRAGDDRPVVAAQFGTLSCVETQAGDKLVLARMDNGGNCAQCEWIDVYTLDGKLLGDTRTPGKAIVDAVKYRKPKQVFAQQDVGGMYLTQAPLPAVAAAPACPLRLPLPERIDDASFAQVSKALDAAFGAVMGADANRLHEDKVMARVAASRADEGRMAALAGAAGCAALVDERGACASFFDPELGNPLGVFTSMKRSAPLRRQFEAALARLPDAAQRRAAQHCMKLVGSP